MKREMIKEEYCTFETCKLLKEAGFPQDSRNYYDVDGNLIIIHEEKSFAAPTQAQVMRWFRDEYGISIEPGISLSDKWLCDVWEFKSILNLFDNDFIFSTFETAAEAGIQAACEYLIEEGGKQ